MTEDLKTNYSKAKYHSPQKYGEKLAIIFIDFANAYLIQIAHWSVLKVVS